MEFITDIVTHFAFKYDNSICNSRIVGQFSSWGRSLSDVYDIAMLDEEFYL